MSPITHLLISWVIAAKTTDNPRDCRLVTIAGVLPDIDGLGLVVDEAQALIHHREPTYFYYQQYHHYYAHGIFGALLATGILVCFARSRWRVAGLCLAVYHLHLLCDLVGSRGPDASDIWPIFYFGPFNLQSMWMWKEQWPLEGWQNRIITVVFFLWALWISTGRQDSFVGVISRRADKYFVATLHKWREQLDRHRRKPSKT